MKLFVVLWILFFASGCAFFGVTKSRERNFDHVEVGQTAAQVTQLLGQPRHRFSDQSGTEIWDYQILSRSRETYEPYRLYFRDSHLLAIRYDTDRATRMNNPEHNDLHEPEIYQPAECVDASGMHSQLAGDRVCDGSSPLN
jgi:outer membrane protein assembly factor BamE (lipoprotein component of BamABCDE complex)